MPSCTRHSTEAVPTHGLSANVWPFPHQEGDSSSDKSPLPAPANLPLATDLTEAQLAQLTHLVKTRLDDLDDDLFSGVGGKDGGDGPNFEGLRFEAPHCELAQHIARNAADALLKARAQEEEAIATAAAARAVAEGAEVAAASQGPQARSATRGCANNMPRVA